VHIAEGFLPPAHAIGWTVAAAPFVVHGARAVVKEVREHPESTLRPARSPSCSVPSSYRA
jgi:cobalt/nickel transport system permease protein